MAQSILKSMLRKFGYEVTRAPRSGVAFPRDPLEAQQRLLRDMETQAPLIFDIGAHKGQTAKEYRALFPDAAIYCFEPFPESIASIKEKLSGDDGVKIVAKAVADRAGRATFYVNEFAPTNSLLPRPTSERRYFPSHAGPKTTIEVETITLDEFVTSEQIADPSILKIDVQGGELMAFQGATKLLERGSVPLIYTEIAFVPHYENSPLLHDLWTFLARYGYTLFDIYELSRASNGQLRFGNALFVSDAVRKNVINARYPEEP
ncbi:MAG TPA: FkbM family methyltransferase [Abditibacteriaceae bacterium]|nr:FkbM family methyltransferase [Abditibacteriaceae bacterium]